MKRCIILLGVMLAGMLKAPAISPNLFHRADIATGNVYTFVAGNLLTAGINYITDDMLFDNSFAYTMFSHDNMGYDFSTKSYNVIGLTSREAFGDVLLGGRVGYQSFSMGSFNWAVYGSAHWKLNQFRTRFDRSADYTRERVSYVMPGAGVLVTLGSINAKIKTVLEAGVRYCLPVGYAGHLGEGTKALDEGLSGHFSAKLGGYDWISGGVYTDIYFFDIYKNMAPRSKFRMFTVGLTFTITPKGE